MIFMKNKIKKCSSCKYFFELYNGDIAGLGRCRRYPPAFNVVDIHKDLIACGEYKKGEYIENKK